MTLNGITTANTRFVCSSRASCFHHHYNGAIILMLLLQTNVITFPWVKTTLRPLNNEKKKVMTALRIACSAVSFSCKYFHKTWWWSVYFIVFTHSCYVKCRDKNRHASLKYQQKSQWVFLCSPRRVGDRSTEPSQRRQMVVRKDTFQPPRECIHGEFIVVQIRWQTLWASYIQCNTSLAAWCLYTKRFLFFCQ